MELSRVRDHEPKSVTDQRREAAVLVPVLDRNGESQMLFTKRAEHLSDHPGQMSYPGGGREPEDQSLVQTAKREANEEIGLQPEEVSVVGRLDDIRTITKYSVRPFVSRIPAREYQPGDGEVAEIAILSLDALMDRENYHSERREHPYYGDIRLHYFYVDGYTVWGATGRMLVQFLELATDWEMPPEPHREVASDADYPV